MTNKIHKESREEVDALNKLGLVSSENVDSMMMLTARDIKIPKPARFSSKRILRMRQRLHCSQQVFAEIIGVTSDTISRWERGEREPEKSICRFLRVLELNGLSVIQ